MKTIALLTAAALLAGCTKHTGDADAYGNFEAVETLISAKAAGELVRFDVEEGQDLAANTRVGTIDTTALTFQLAEIAANKDAVASNARNLAAQIAVQDETLKNLQREEERLVRLVEGGAATTKQLDDMRGEIAVVKKRIATISTQDPSVAAQLRAFDAKRDQVRQTIADHAVVNPVHGTVVAKLAEDHELAAPGKALYRIAQLDTLELRAYISGAHLSQLKLGTTVDVGIDDGAGKLARVPGRVSWISSEAEFTPKTIQTREERVDLVYAFKVRVANSDGRLKAGMPGEVYLTSTP